MCEAVQREAPVSSLLGIVRQWAAAAEAWYMMLPTTASPPGLFTLPPAPAGAMLMFSSCVTPGGTGGRAGSSDGEAARQRARGGAAYFERVAAAWVAFALAVGHASPPGGREVVVLAGDGDASAAWLTATLRHFGSTALAAAQEALWVPTIATGRATAALQRAADAALAAPPPPPSAADAPPVALEADGVAAALHCAACRGAHVATWHAAATGAGDELRPWVVASRCALSGALATAAAERLGEVVVATTLRASAARWAVDAVITPLLVRVAAGDAAATEHFDALRDAATAAADAWAADEAATCAAPLGSLLAPTSADVAAGLAHDLRTNDGRYSVATLQAQYAALVDGAAATAVTRTASAVAAVRRKRAAGSPADPVVAALRPAYFGVPPPVQLRTEPTPLPHPLPGLSFLPPASDPARSLAALAALRRRS